MDDIDDGCLSLTRHFESFCLTRVKFNRIYGNSLPLLLVRYARRFLFSFDFYLAKHRFLRFRYTLPTRFLFRFHARVRVRVCNYTVKYSNVSLKSVYFIVNGKYTKHSRFRSLRWKLKYRGRNLFSSYSRLRVTF